MPGFDKQVYFKQLLLDGLRLNYSINIENHFSYILVVIYGTLTVKPIKEFMYFWVPSIAFPKLMSLYIHYKTNTSVSVVQESIIDIMLTSSLRETILVKSLVYFSSLYPCFASLFDSSLLSIF